MRLRVPTLLLVTTGLIGGAALTNHLAGWVEGSPAQNTVAAAASAPALISAVSPAEASEVATAAEAHAAATPKAVKKVSANMVCREAAWPYVQRRCETPSEREGQAARHVRIISLDRNAPRTVVAPSAAIAEANRMDTTQTGVASLAVAAAAAQGTQHLTGDAPPAVTTLPPARPDLIEASASAVPTTASESVDSARQDVAENAPAVVPETKSAAKADPAPQAKTISRHRVRAARRMDRDDERRYARDDDSIDPGYDPRSTVRTTVTYGYRYPDGRQYYYRDGGNGRRQDLAYRDYPPPPAGYAYAHRRSLGESLFGWLSDD